MNGVIQFLVEAPTIIKMVIIVLAVLFALFIGAFLVPAARSWFRLSALARKLKTLNGRRAQPLDDLFSGQGVISDLWKDYKDSLHDQQEFENGRVGVRKRSTVPASSVFADEIVVDSPLSTEFFKHLPGLFTGVGIIGTFWGLIQGLQAFRISEDPSVVRNSLEGLMHRVSDAFIVSATAIFLAMATTFLEKMLITILYGKVGDIAASLDRMFDSGAGEEYLARIVKAAEETSEQSKLLKDALITDLTRILTDLTDRQIEANKLGFHGVGTHVEEILSEPLDKIRKEIGQATGGNSDAVAKLLTDVLAGFSQKLQDLFGGQISGINQLQQKTIDSLESAVGKLNEMVANIGVAGAKTSDAMNERLVVALSAMEAHQRRTNEQISAFVEILRGLVSESQSETNRKLQETLAEIGEAVRAQIAALKAQGDDAAAKHGDREDKISSQTQEALRLLGTRVEDMSISVEK